MARNFDDKKEMMILVRMMIANDSNDNKCRSTSANSMPVNPTALS